MSWEGVTNNFITHSGSLKRYLFPSNSEFCHPLPKISNKCLGVLIEEIRYTATSWSFRQPHQYRYDAIFLIYVQELQRMWSSVNEFGVDLWRKSVLLRS